MYIHINHNVMTNNDLGLVKVFQSGNRDAYIDLYDKYVKKIYKFIYFKTTHKETAEDLTSKTFLKALKNLENFSSKDNPSFSAWLYTIARNTVTDHYRTFKTADNIEDVWDLASDENLLQDAEMKERSHHLRELLKQLDTYQREIVMLRIYQEMSYKEIAEVLNKSEAACKMDYSRTIKRLKEMMPIEVLAMIIISGKILLDI